MPLLSAMAARHHHKVVWALPVACFVLLSLLTFLSPIRVAHAVPVMARSWARTNTQEAPGIEEVVLTAVDSSGKNRGKGLEVGSANRGFLHFMATADKKGMHLAQAVSSIREINVTAAAAIQAAAALPAMQGASADDMDGDSSDVFTKNMGGLLAYQGGQMMTQPDTLRIYVIWYGKWTGVQKRIIRTFLQSLDRKANKYESFPTVVGWWSINVRYYRNGAKQRATPFVKVAGETDDDYSMAPFGTAKSPMSHDQVGKDGERERGGGEAGE